MLFLRKIDFPQPQVIPGAAAPVPHTGSPEHTHVDKDVPVPHTGPPEHAHVDKNVPFYTETTPNPKPVPTTTVNMKSKGPSKKPRALARLDRHNEPGSQEAPRSTRRRRGGGGAEVQDEV